MSNYIKPKILVVNDNSTELSSLQSGLESEDIMVSTATDGFSALELLEKETYDFVLIDLMLPDLNALKLARRIRDIHPEIKTLLMSDYILSPVQLAKADTGAIGFVSMPCRYHDIACLIKEKAQTRREENLFNTQAPTPFEVLSVRYSC